MKLNTYRIETRGRGRIPICVREATFDIGEYGCDGPHEMSRIACQIYRLPYIAEEYVIIIALDIKARPKAAFEVAHGTPGYAPVTAAEVLRRVLLSGADMFIMLHNHPSGDVAPSAADKETCAKLGKASEIIGVRMVDFIIIGKRGRYFSFLENKLI